MYRILDVERALSHLPGTHRAVRAAARRGATRSSPRSAARGRFAFRPHRSPQRDDTARPDATLTIGIHDLVVGRCWGRCSVRDVVRHRLATVEPARALAMVDAAFRADQPPYCTTRF